MNISQKLESLIKELEKNDSVKIEELSFGNTPTNEFLKEIIFEDTNVKLFDFISSIYDQISSLRLEWKCNLLEKNFC